MSTTAFPILPMPNARIALYQIVQDRLQAATGQSLAEFIMVRRQPGSEVPYRHVAAEIVELTGVDITHEAVRRWFHKITAEMEAVVPAHAAALQAQFTS